jgi:hypothetical protein
VTGSFGPKDTTAALRMTVGPKDTTAALGMTVAHYSLSKIPAAPMPPPTHIVTSP